MPTISVEQSLLRDLVESKGRVHDIEDLAFRLPLMGTDIDRCDSEILISKFSLTDQTYSLPKPCSIA